MSGQLGSEIALCCVGELSRECLEGFLVVAQLLKLAGKQFPRQAGAERVAFAHAFDFDFHQNPLSRS